QPFPATPIALHPDSTARRSSSHSVGGDFLLCGAFVRSNRLRTPYRFRRLRQPDVENFVLCRNQLPVRSPPTRRLIAVPLFVVSLAEGRKPVRRTGKSAQVFDSAAGFVRCYSGARWPILYSHLPCSALPSVASLDSRRPRRVFCLQSVSNDHPRCLFTSSCTSPSGNPFCAGLYKKGLCLPFRSSARQPRCQPNDYCGKPRQHNRRQMKIQETEHHPCELHCEQCPTQSSNRPWRGACRVPKLP